MTEITNEHLLNIGPQICTFLPSLSGLRGGGKTYPVIVTLSVGINIPTEVQMCKALGFSESIQPTSWKPLIRLKKLLELLKVFIIIEY